MTIGRSLARLRCAFCGSSLVAPVGDDAPEEQTEPYCEDCEHDDDLDAQRAADEVRDDQAINLL